MKAKSAMLWLLPMCMAAQPPSPRAPSVQATGEAVVQVKPDQAKLNIGVVTQAASAQAAATQNASTLETTLAKLKAALGTAGEVRTAAYSLSPNYQYPRDGGKPSITGYTASNTVEVTTSDLAALGKLIDTASQSGANQIQGLQFLVKDESAARARALRQAVQDARGNAEAMAGSLGMKLGRVITLEQGTPQVIRPVMRAQAAALAAPTPVEPGDVEVHASVTLTIALE